MKWEYIITSFRSTREGVTDELNKLADEEWEAVAITSDGHVLTSGQKATDPSLTPPNARALDSGARNFQGKFLFKLWVSVAVQNCQLLSILVMRKTAVAVSKKPAGVKNYASPQLFSALNPKLLGTFVAPWSCRWCGMLKYPIERSCPRCSCEFMIVFLDINPWIHSIRGYCRNCDHSIDWKLIHNKISSATQNPERIKLAFRQK